MLYKRPEIVSPLLVQFPFCGDGCSNEILPRNNTYLCEPTFIGAKPFAWGKSVAYAITLVPPLQSDTQRVRKGS